MSSLDGGVGKTTPFNSLFEMQKRGVVVRLHKTSQLPFNSLFEMQLCHASVVSPLGSTFQFSI